MTGRFAVGVLLAGGLLSGCVSPRATLENAEGDRVTCRASGFGLVSGTLANNRFQECVSDAQMRGYDIVSQGDEQ